MKLPPLSSVPACISHPDLHRCSLEAMLAGLSDPPDAFAEDWEETMEEVERLLVEAETREGPQSSA